MQFMIIFVSQLMFNIRIHSTFSGLVLEVVEIVMEGAPCRHVGVYMGIVDGLTAVNLALYYGLLVPAPVVKQKDLIKFYYQDDNIKSC